MRRLEAYYLSDRTEDFVRLLEGEGFQIERCGPNRKIQCPNFIPSVGEIYNESMLVVYAHQSKELFSKGNNQARYAQAISKLQKIARQF